MLRRGGETLDAAIPGCCEFLRRSVILVSSQKGLEQAMGLRLRKGPRVNGESAQPNEHLLKERLIIYSTPHVRRFLDIFSSLVLLDSQQTVVSTRHDR